MNINDDKLGRCFDLPAAIFLVVVDALVYVPIGLVFRSLLLVCSFFTMLLFIVQYGRLGYSLDQTMTIPY